MILKIGSILNELKMGSVSLCIEELGIWCFQTLVAVFSALPWMAVCIEIENIGV